jgi:phosphoglycolate phosphatase-like HAD superfamily hydrolase
LVRAPGPDLMAATFPRSLRVALEKPLGNGRLKPTPAVVLFDLDGTLVDTMQAFADLAAVVMTRRFGVALRTARKLYLETSGIPFLQQLEGIFGEHPSVVDAATEYEARKHAIAAAAEMDGATRAALENVRARGVGLVVSSNGMQKHVDRFAARSAGLFDLALGFGGALAKGEPHISLVEKVLGVRRDRLVFIGDSLRDGELAEASGVRFIGRSGTFTRREMAARFPAVPVIDSVTELPALL